MVLHNNDYIESNEEQMDRNNHIDIYETTENPENNDIINNNKINVNKNSSISFNDMNKQINNKIKNNDTNNNNNEFIKISEINEFNIMKEKLMKENELLKENYHLLYEENLMIKHYLIKANNNIQLIQNKLNNLIKQEKNDSLSDIINKKDIEIKKLKDYIENNINNINMNDNDKIPDNNVSSDSFVLNVNDLDPDNKNINNKNINNHKVTTTKSNGLLKRGFSTFTRMGSSFNLSNEIDKIDDEWKKDDEILTSDMMNPEEEKIQSIINKLSCDEERDTLRNRIKLLLQNDNTKIDYNNEQNNVIASFKDLTLTELTEETENEIRQFILPLLRNQKEYEIEPSIRKRYIYKSDIRLSFKTIPTVNKILHIKSKSNLLLDKKNAQNDHLFMGPSIADYSMLVPHEKRTVHFSKELYISQPKEEFKDTISNKNRTKGPKRQQSISEHASSFVFNRFKRFETVIDDVKSRLSTSLPIRTLHIHENSKCNECGVSPIKGGKYTCMVCDQYELCDTCYSEGKHGFEFNSVICERIGRNAMIKYRGYDHLGYTLFSSIKDDLCENNIFLFRYVIQWIDNIISGKLIDAMQYQVIVKDGLDPIKRSSIVADISTIACNRTDIVVKTEWVPYNEPNNEYGKTSAATEILRIYVSTGTTHLKKGNVFDI